VPTLGYCLNVHPGESLAAIVGNIRGAVAQARKHLGWSTLPVGLWLPGPVAREVAHDSLAFTRLAGALAEAGATPFTANAFPIGGFHAARVGREVYKPTWSSGERLSYTLDVAAALAMLLPEGAKGSISTVPVGYTAFAEDAAALDWAGTTLAIAAGSLERIAERTGRSLALALEPEPLAVLETSSDAVAFLEARVFSGHGRAALEQMLDLDEARAEAILRERVGVCLDACHHAVAFEPIGDALDRYARAGVRVVKAQLSSALAVARPAENAPGVARLRAFHEPRWLHQTFARRDGAIERVEEIELAFDQTELRAPFRDAAEVRSHFHVPLAWAGGDGLSTTRDELRAALPAIARATDHLEVETYTWSVLPQAERAAFGDDVAAMVAAELAWARRASG
jgi:hypothetical protein